MSENSVYVNQCATECNSILTGFLCTGESIQRTREIPSVLTADIRDEIEAAARSVESFDPCYSYFDNVEIEAVRRALKKGKGSVGLRNDHLRKIGSTGIDEGIRRIVNMCWHFSYFPTEYLTSILHPVFKGGADRSAMDVDSYRPIATSDTVGCVVNI